MRLAVIVLVVATASVHADPPGERKRPTAAERKAVEKLIAPFDSAARRVADRDCDRIARAFTMLHDPRLDVLLRTHDGAQQAVAGDYTRAHPPERVVPTCEHDRRVEPVTHLRLQ